MRPPSLPVPQTHETLDTLANGTIQLLQPQVGHRVALDPLLLADFVSLRQGERVADLGTGNGVIPLLLARQSLAASFVGIELNAEAAELARRNVVLNRLAERIEIVQEDVRALRSGLLRQSFDVVVSNPPYRTPGSGQLAPDAGRAAARHELHGGIREFLDTARFLLRNSGRFYAIYLPERLTELLSALEERKIEPKRLRMIHPRQGERAVLVLVEGRRAGRVGGLVVEAPLTVHDAAGEYSEELQRILRGER